MHKLNRVTTRALWRKYSDGERLDGKKVGFKTMCPGNFVLQAIVLNITEELIILMYLVEKIYISLSLIVNTLRHNSRRNDIPVGIVSMISIKNKVSAALKCSHSAAILCHSAKSRRKKYSCLLQLSEKSLMTPNPMPLSIKVTSL